MKQKILKLFILIYEIVLLFYMIYKHEPSLICDFIALQSIFNCLDLFCNQGGFNGSLKQRILLFDCMMTFAISAPYFIIKRYGTIDLLIWASEILFIIQIILFIEIIIENCLEDVDKSFSEWYNIPYKEGNIMPETYEKKQLDRSMQKVVFKVVVLFVTFSLSVGSALFGDSLEAFYLAVIVQAINNLYDSSFYIKGYNVGVILLNYIIMIASVIVIVGSMFVLVYDVPILQTKQSAMIIIGGLAIPIAFYFSYSLWLIFSRKCE